MTPAPHSAPMPRLVEGDAVTLALWDPTLTAAMYRLIDRSRPTLSQFLAWAAEPASPKEQLRVREDALSQWRRGEMAPWAILEGDDVCGALGLHRRGGPDELEIGYWLDDAATGRGLMTSACRLATDVAFTVPGIEFVEILHDAANVRSAGVPRRLGFSRIAAFTSAVTAPGESGIKVRWRMSRATWLARGAGSSVRRIE